MMKVFQKPIKQITPSAVKALLPQSMLHMVVATTMMAVATTAYADINKKMIGDLEIYAAPAGGSATVVMMLDMSRTMTQIGDDYPELESAYSSYCYYTDGTGKKSIQVDYPVSMPFINESGQQDGTVNFTVRGCPTESGAFGLNEGYLDRVSRLKKALLGVLADSTKLSSDNKIGIGVYPWDTNSEAFRGIIAKPAKPLTTQHRKDLISYIVTLDAKRYNTTTPIAQAYAEAGAYMLGTNTKFDYRLYTGYEYAGEGTQKTDGSYNYISPITGNSECGGNGIYFLTDGEPNASGTIVAIPVMNKSLGEDLLKEASNPNYCQGTISDAAGSESYNAWECIGEYGRILYDNHDLKTATVGFGGSYQNTGDNCSSISDKDARYLCRLGSPDQEYGRGGFTGASSADDLANSFQNFVLSLQGQSIESAPSGIIVVPDDPFNANKRQAVAYYPTIDAKVTDANSIWPGNMKKYALSNGTLYGKSDIKLFDIDGLLNSVTQDLWSDRNYLDETGLPINEQITSGGLYANLASPSSGIESIRNVYLEDKRSDGTLGLRKLGVNSAGKVVLSEFNSFNDLKPITDSYTFEDTTTYTDDKIKDVLAFLGFQNISETIAVKDLTLTVANNAPEALKTLGASMHSTPALVAYSAELDKDGQVTNDRDQYVLFGSMDGAMHLVDSDNQGTDNGGEEKFAFIPRKIIQTQSKALVPNSTHDKTGVPDMGMDAPWLVVADYDYNFDAGTSSGDVTAVSTHAYGGMRMGGDSFYAMDLTDQDNPRIDFVIDPTGSFNRMGQIWSKPTKTKIKMSSTQEREVLVFGGGYDTCYENEGFQIGSPYNSTVQDAKGASCNKTEAQGNAVYIVDAETGDLIWSASKSQNSDMVNSIVGEITVLDRNGDGFMDHLYFADLGGQVFRADFLNAGVSIPSRTGDEPREITSFTSTRVVKLLNNTFTGAELPYTLRFYERPVVSFYRNPNTNRLFAMVNVNSGDRSSPLSEIRTDLRHSDRLYGIMDTDVTKPDQFLYDNDFYSSSDFGVNQGNVRNLTDNDFYSLPRDMDPANTSGTYTLAQKNTLINSLRNGDRQGWYYPLTMFDGYNNVRYSKGTGKSAVIGGFLYTSVYNPDMKYSASGGCSVETLGTTERQLYCLPYGICTDDSSANGTGGFIRAGKGIQDLTLGPVDDEIGSPTVLVSDRTIEERAKDRSEYNKGKESGYLKKAQESLGSGSDKINNKGAGTAAEFEHKQRYTLTSTKWFEQNE